MAIYITEYLRQRKYIEFACALEPNFSRFGVTDRARTNYVEVIIYYNKNVNEQYRIKEEEFEEFKEFFDSYRVWLLYLYLRNGRTLSSYYDFRMLNKKKYNCTDFISKNGAMSYRVLFMLSTMRNFLFIEDKTSNICEKMAMGLNELEKSFYK